MFQRYLLQTTISDDLKLSQWQTNLKMHSLTKNLLRQSVFVVDLEQTPFFLKSYLNINNIAVLLRFWKTYIFCQIWKNIFSTAISILQISLPFGLERSSLYPTTKVFLTFTERIIYHFYHKCDIQQWLIG